MKINFLQCFIIAGLTIFPLSLTFGGEIATDTTVVLTEAIQKQVIGELKGKFHFTDDRGQHILILAREYNVDTSGKESIVLRVIQFQLTKQEWKQEWIIKDFVECQNLDISGDFCTNLTSFSDLDTNNIVETTIAYQTICAGGIEPKSTKVIMRQGADKYAVRGESLVQIDDKNTFGGTFKADQQLDSLPKFKRQLVNSWKQAAGVTR